MLNKIGVYKLLDEFLSDYTIKDRFLVIYENKNIVIKKSNIKYTRYEILKRIEVDLNSYPYYKTFTCKIEHEKFIIKPVKSVRRFKHLSQVTLNIF